ncbi:hypothetical protein [Microvirga roseola]|uniref:hypothetical protein n=1 Tax=Microvirga roseola TaxID=2883126 RepID=UPI001E63FF92|nr:hypothetical protein [Microvirga roseola]
MDRTSDEAAGRPTYNLFRRTLEPDIYCAVPEDRAVPGLIQGSEWQYCLTLTPRETRLWGLFDEEADRGTRLNGFYLFMRMRSGGRAAVASIPERRAAAGNQTPPAADPNQASAIRCCSIS